MAYLPDGTLCLPVFCFYNAAFMLLVCVVFRARFNLGVAIPVSILSLLVHQCELSCQENICITLRKERKAFPLKSFN